MTSIESRRASTAAFFFLLLTFSLVMGQVACDGTGQGGGRVDVSLGDAYDAWKSDDPPIFLDVRTASEYDQAHIEGSIHIPHTEVASRIDELRAADESRVIVYCERGGRARTAEAALAEAGGFEVQHMEGDMRGWRRNDLPVVRGGR